MNTGHSRKHRGFRRGPVRIDYRERSIENWEMIPDTAKNPGYRYKSVKMKYLCLVYGEENKIATMDDHECLACDADLRASGHCIASEALEAVATAATVRIRNGRLSISDGPSRKRRRRWRAST